MYVEPFLNHLGELNLFMVGNPLDVFLNWVCKYLVETFSSVFITELLTYNSLSLMVPYVDKVSG